MTNFVINSLTRKFLLIPNLVAPVPRNPWPGARTGLEFGAPFRSIQIVAGLSSPGSCARTCEASSVLLRPKIRAVPIKVRSIKVRSIKACQIRARPSRPIGSPDRRQTCRPKPPRTRGTAASDAEPTSTTAVGPDQTAVPPDATTPGAAAGLASVEFSIDGDCGELSPKISR